MYNRTISIFTATLITLTAFQVRNAEAAIGTPGEKPQPEELLLPKGNGDAVGMIIVQSGKKPDASFCATTAWKGDTVITAAHCFPQIKINVKRIRVGFRAKKGDKLFFDCKTKPVWMNKVLDYAIIECPGLSKDVAAATVSPRIPKIGDTLTLATYDVDELNKGLRVEVGKYAEESEVWLPVGGAKTFPVETYSMTGAKTDHGNSASPVFDWVEKGGGVLGFVLGGPADDTGSTDVIPVSAILKDLKNNAPHLINSSVAVGNAL